MAISPSLQQFKSSGVYRLEFDKSQITNIPSETIRLIIGFSKKGPFNTPIFVQDAIFFKTVFGDIDLTLERKGSFFHRTVLTCLNRGPVVVLNLLTLNDLLDKSQFQSISTAAYQENSPARLAPVSSYFNKDKFWFTDPTSLVDTTKNIAYQSSTKQRLLNVSNVGRKTVSVIFRKSDVLGFDVTAKDWYSVGKVPFFMRDNDYISDYMIDVIVVEGDFSNYNILSIDPIFGDYFEQKGLKKTYVDDYGYSRDGLTTFLNLDQVNVLGVYTGSLIPDFQDKNGNNMFIEDLVNLETAKTGVLLGIDKDMFDNSPDKISGYIIDLVGHTIEDEAPATIEFLSYYGSITEFISFNGATATSKVWNVGVTGVTGTTANALFSASSTLQAISGWTSLGSTGYFDTITIYGPNSTMPGPGYSAGYTGATWNALVNSISVNSYVAISGVKLGTGTTAGTATFAKARSVDYDATADTLTVKIELAAGTDVVGPSATLNDFYYMGGVGKTVGVTGGTVGIRIIESLNFKVGGTFSGASGIIAGPNSDIYTQNLSGIITDGDGINIAAPGLTSIQYASFSRGATNNFGNISGISSSSVFGTSTVILNNVVNYLNIQAYENTNLSLGLTSISGTAPFRFRTLTGSINQSFQVSGTYTNPTNVVYLDNSANGPLGLNGYTSGTNGKFLKGHYLVMNHGGTGTPTIIDPLTNSSRLTKIISMVEDLNPTSATYKRITVTTNDPIYISNTNEVERYQDIRDFVDHYRFSSLSGYTLRDAQMPDGSAQRQAAILDELYDTNLAKALEDREVITFRYIVDSFQGVIEPASKIRLTRLAKARQSALAICNMPSVKQFKDSTNPLFKMDSTSSFSTQYIPTGGNLNLNPSNVFSLPGIADGANYSAFYGPNLIIRENGHNVSVPPAAHVSNLYIDKYNLALPYSIVAGPRRGIVTGEGLVGVEFAFDRNDLDFIEPFGYNAILNKRGFGLTINANQTAQQNIKSALSQVHVRELLIYIQDGIEAILKNYRWEFNTAQNRLEIKTLADNFLSQILSDGGVYDFQNIMDNTNNTNEIIDNNIGILDTYLEPVRGMGILVHRTTILKTGAIATGNFM